MNTVDRLRAGWDWALGYALIGVGAVGLVVGSVGVSGSHYVADQLSFMVSSGLGGLLLLGAGGTLVITAGLADEWRKLDRVAAGLPWGTAQPPAEVLVRQARAVAAGGLVIGALIVILTWTDVSGEADPQRGLESLGAGSVGVVVSGLAAGGSILWLKRRVQARKAQLLAPWDTQPAPAMAGLSHNGARPSTNGRVLVAAGLTRFHRSGCPALAGLASREVNRQDLPPTLEACELCQTVESAL